MLILAPLIFSDSCQAPQEENFISKLIDEEMLVTGHDDKAKIIDDFDTVGLLGTSKDQDYTINPNDLSISFGDLADLDAPFSKDVWETIC